MNRPKLMIPGPVDLTDEVREELGGPMLAHYGGDWVALYRETVGLLRQVFKTHNDLFLMVGSGSAGVDAALGSMLRGGDKILIPDNGFFGLRMATIARSYGLQVMHLKFPWDQAVDPGVVRKHLASDPDIKLVSLVHHETSTGMLNPVQDVAAAAREHNVPVLVDAIASMGGLPVPVDEWGLDVVVAVGNKCLAAPPGLVIVSVNQRAWDLMSSRSDRNHGWYLNLETWHEYAETWAGWHPYPVTLPTPTIMALRASLRQILAQGLAAHYEKHVRAAQKMRDGLLSMGFKLYLRPEYVCPIVTAFEVPPGLPVGELTQFLQDEHNILAARGMGEMRDKIIRVGHMGLATSEEYVESFLTGVRSYLQRSSPG